MMSPLSQPSPEEIPTGTYSPIRSLELMVSQSVQPVANEAVETEFQYQYQPVFETLHTIRQLSELPSESLQYDTTSTCASTLKENFSVTSHGLKRPFKAVSECVAAAAPSPSYAAFRAAMLEAMCAKNGGSLTVSNPRMRRYVHREEGATDPEYNYRRQRNNAAAKRSRDLRKLREDELAIRLAFLERENEELRGTIAEARANPVSCDSCWSHL